MKPDPKCPHCDGRGWTALCNVREDCACVKRITVVAPKIVLPSNAGILLLGELNPVEYGWGFSPIVYQLKDFKDMYAPVCPYQIPKEYIEESWAKAYLKSFSERWEGWPCTEKPK